MLPACVSKDKVRHRTASLRVVVSTAGWVCLRRWRFAVGGEAGGGGARRSRVAGWRGLPSRSCVRGRLRPSPTPTSHRCSAPRASSRGRRRSRPVLTAHRTAPTRAPRPRCARQPWAPALLAAAEIAKQDSPPAPLGNLLAGLGSRQKHALAKASEDVIRGAPTRSHWVARWQAKAWRASRRAGLPRSAAQAAKWRSKVSHVSRSSGRTCLTFTLASASAL